MVGLHHLGSALLRLQLDRLELFRRGDTLAGSNIGEFDPLQAVLIQLIEIDGQVQNPHKHVPLTPNCPVCRLLPKTGRNIGQTILRRQGVQRTFAEAGE
ncbi:MAG: hypothetical protein WBK08_01780 [Nitrospira sp.]